MWANRPQNRQNGSAFALTYILRRRSCRLIGVFVMSPLPPVLSEELRTVGSLCSTGITPLHRYDGPLRHPLVFGRFPGGPVIRPPLLHRFRDGTRRASPVAQRGLVPMLSLPPRRSDSPCQPGCDGSCCLRLHSGRLGLRGSSLSGPPVRSLTLRPGDSPASRRRWCRWASEIRFPSSLPSEL